MWSISGITAPQQDACSHSSELSRLHLPLLTVSSTSTLNGSRYRRFTQAQPMRQLRPGQGERATAAWSSVQAFEAWFRGPRVGQLIPSDRSRDVLVADCCAVLFCTEQQSVRSSDVAFSLSCRLGRVTTGSPRRHRQILFCRHRTGSQACSGHGAVSRQNGTRLTITHSWRDHHALFRAFFLLWN